jgi:hypothetical protein
VQNLNLRHIYFLRFLIFCAVFARLASKFEKSTNMTKNKFFYQKRCQKTQNFMLISNSLEKFFLKMHQKTVVSKTSLTNMSKTRKRKSAYFRHIFANTFCGTFFKTFSTDLKSA